MINNPQIEWNYHRLSVNKNITQQHLDEYPDLPWAEGFFLAKLDRIQAIGKITDAFTTLSTEDFTMYWISRNHNLTLSDFSTNRVFWNFKSLSWNPFNEKSKSLMKTVYYNTTIEKID